MMRKWAQHVVWGICLGMTGWAMAQSGTETSASDKQRARAAAAKAPAAKVTPAKPRREVAQKPAPVPAVFQEVLPPLEPELVAIAEQVHLGQITCEMGQTVVITPDEKSPGRFYMHHQRQTYHLAPVQSRTGALRLEDPHKGAVWIQLSNKSMLMNSQLGQRLADECQSPAQAAVAQAMKLAPPINLLEGGRDVARQ
jgi:hypothetical protein